MQIVWIMLAAIGFGGLKGPNSSALAASDSIDIVYDRPKATAGGEAGEQRVFSVEALFKNSFFATGLASGTDAINRSLESLMHTVFYGLMDNEFRFPTSRFSAIGLDLTRDIYSTRQGPFVVVD